MNKSKLKDGDKLTLRNGEIGYFIGNHGIVIQGGTTYNFDHYLDDLIDRWNGDIYDIVKVERIQISPYTVVRQSYVDCPAEMFNEYLTYQTIWERETRLEQPKKIEPMQNIVNRQDGDATFMNMLANKINELIERENQRNSGGAE